MYLINGKMVKASEAIGKIVDVSEEKNTKLKKSLIDIANKEKSVLMAMIAPYVGVKVTPSKTSTAHLGILEEFGLETAIEKIKESDKTAEKLYLLLNSPGGLISSSYKVARALRNNFKEITVFIPHIAASGGTLVAIAGNEIIMGMMSQLTPLDPNEEINGRYVSSASVIRGFEYVTEYFKDISPEDAPYTYKVLAEKYDAVDIDGAISIMHLMENYISELLKGSGYKEDKVEEIAEKLVSGYLDHGEVITFEKASEIGLNISEPEKYPEVWNTFREWLGSYMIQSADKHIIRYIVPKRQKEVKK